MSSTALPLVHSNAHGLEAAMSKPVNVRTKKLLVAAVGVASVSYLACGTSTTSGNLVAPPGDGSTNAVDAQNEAANDALISSGNLVAPMPEASADSPADSRGEAQADAPLQQLDVFIGSGNLVAPLPDAGSD
jgi:hypothetical protein